MSHFDAWSQVVLISKREDVVFFCTKAFSNMTTIHAVTSLNELSENDAGFLVYDFTFADQIYLSRLTQIPDRIQKSICLLSSFVSIEVQNQLRKIFSFVIYYNSSDLCAQKLKQAFQIVKNNYENSLRPLPIITEDVSLGPYFLGESEVMKLLRLKIKHVSLMDSVVLLLGETGTGKTTAAKVIHEKSKRKKGPFVSVSLSALVPTMIEASLFGTATGMFTGSKNCMGAFERADGGIIFIDEVGIPEQFIQSKFLTVIETGRFSRVGSSASTKVNVRAIFATNGNIKAKLKTGEFRMDFYQRICLDLIELPPLRKHKEDIPLIAAEFLKQKKCNKILSEDTIKKLQDYNWPGNVRELQHCLERAINSCREEIICSEYIDFGVFNPD